MEFLYIPLDERPCNVYYPQIIAELQADIQLTVPPRELLSQKKQPAKTSRLWDWLEINITDCRAALLSIEMLVYGGLLPSRLHQESISTLTQRLYHLRKLKAEHPQVEIFASNLIMRTPAYSSSEEEPDYYETCGEQIFQWGWLQDKCQRVGLTAAEQAQLDHIQAELPSEYLQDYQKRRACNVAVNLAVIELVQAGVISFLSIPQDDSAPYGFTAIDQRQVVAQVTALRLQQQVHLYPGADEVGCTLLARAYNQVRGRSPQIYLLYSSVCSEQIVPLYEDRPLGESVKAHVLAAGAQVATTPEAADAVLAVNTAGQVMQEAWDQSMKDITYTSFRNLRFFVAEIERLQNLGKSVAIADVAFANGGETELVEMLDDAALWDSLLAYAGWNTSCNTLGTVLATASLGLGSENKHALAFNKIYHLLEDWAYQSIVRKSIIGTCLPRLGASYYDFNRQEALITQTIAEQLLDVWCETLQQSFTSWDIQQLSVFAPWQRMFEMGLNLEIAPTE
ncbi:hypothetical protein C1752_00687 [Acaryochloris thomasi RCC1774]|uniref:DUF4127 family protein n=1 Tax=Acaryochloris thomasi RCC1774 TaxID=1764569 RepID=A0A2W1JMH7_9CYAN|nr:DUF4127 family protein [Acaryochloris thomasi]PZD74518.1 hypothetical protein C1752_00687 [Acaryochloris thomasi RCC1774]